METMKIQVGFRCIADVKRIIPKPKGVRGKCKYMMILRHVVLIAG